ncbi:MAG: hypothetical protein PW999_07780 [Paraburkholderia tropica]|nr:hypothetical protein [Paraburkholderia tropica]
MSWNPRYLAYCYAHGSTPEAMRESDRVKFPGGKFAGFMCWNGEQWREFEKVRTMGRLKTTADHSAYDEWLKTKFFPAQLDLFA